MVRHIILKRFCAFFIIFCFPFFSITPALCYELSETTSFDTSKNVIVKYEYNSSTGLLSPKYYKVNLENTNYGNGDTTINYGWVQNENGEYEFGETDSSNSQITFTYDSNANTVQRTEISENESAENISGDFRENTYTAESGVVYSSGINNDGTIGSINSNFINNCAHSNNNTAVGAAVSNGGAIGMITGDFAGNHVSTNSTETNGIAYGGAVFNYMMHTIDLIEGDFIGNYAEGNYEAAGGAVNNNVMGGLIDDIEGDFIGNSVTSPETGRGGAISNSYYIYTINGDFIGNYASGENDYAGGGAIEASWSFTRTENVTGDFIGNYAISQNGFAAGGAIVNGGTFLNLTGDFIQNHLIASQNTTGGAIDNGGTMENITGDFIQNYAQSENSYAYGGAINNVRTIGNITGDFYGNHTSAASTSYGGAIYNSGAITKTEGNFIANYAESSKGASAYAIGGAIYNSGTISEILNDFIGNYSEVLNDKDAFAYGGALYNGQDGVIENITGDFIQNRVSIKSETEGGLVIGGAIENSGTIGDITGNFTDNYAKGESELNLGIYGGAIDNTGETGKITGNFSRNYVSSKAADGTAQALGGAVYNSGLIADDIEGNFIENYTEALSDESALLYSYGGALYNTGEITNGIKGNFISNYASANSQNKTSTVLGGAVYNSGLIADIEGNIIENQSYALSETSDALAYGGGIYNHRGASIENIKGNFSNNSARALSDLYNADAYGGAVVNGGTIENIAGDFLNNRAAASGTDASAKGGAIYNYADATGSEQVISTIGNIKGNFTGNVAEAISNTNAEASGGAVYNGSNEINEAGAQGIINDIEGNFSNNSATAQGLTGAISYGGAIYSQSGFGEINELENIKGTFEDNKIIANTTDGNAAGYGGAISTSLTMAKNIEGDFINNSVSVYSKTGNAVGCGGAVSNAALSTISNLEGNFINNNVNVKGINAAGYGGAVSNILGIIGEYDEEGQLTSGIRNSSFYNNHVSAEGETAEAKGGAIYSNMDLKISADNGESIFSGNYTETNGIKKENAIYMANDMVESYNGTLTLESINNGLILFNDEIEGDIGYNLVLKGDETSEIIFNNDIINAEITIENTNVTANYGSYLAQSPTLTLNSGTLSINHLPNAVINFENLSNKGLINLNSIDVDLSNKTMGRITSDSYGDMTGTVDVKGLNIISHSNEDNISVPFADEHYSNTVKYSGNNEILTPVYKYYTDYEIKNDNMGYFTFNRGNINDSDSYNPSVLAPSVSSQAGAYTTQLQTLEYAFKHSDAFMALPSFERMAIINADRYALTPTSDATDIGTFSPLMTKLDVSGFWVKPYTSFESIPLDNGPKVSNISYGTLVGYDSNLKHLKNGWERVLTGYIGYNGASQRYSGIDTYQNGGILGLTTTFYKNNFFNATTISTGATVGNSSTYYGDEDYTMLTAGIGNKFGYNFEFKDGKFILQPNLLLSYTFINTFDYTNASGLKIKSDPLHALQIAPGIKFIMNTESGWQPYLRADMIWNILDKTKVTANDVRLPEMSIDPYVQYGIGVQKLFKNERLTFFGQALVQNGGRNGVSLNAGLRWAVGRGE